MPIKFLRRRFPRTIALLTRFRQPVAYLVVGGFAGLVHLTVAFSAMHFGGIEPAHASLIGFVVANPFSYVGHKLVTFMVPGRDVFEVARFVVSALIGLALASAIPYALIDGLAVPRLAALAVTVIVIPIVNFLAMRFWVFAHGLKQRDIAPR
ncbi:MAG TPA: GtrA family protein [Parvibaculum sp.]